MQPAIALQPVLERYRALGPALYWTITAIGAVWCFLIVYGIVGYGACANTGTVPCDAYSYWAVDAHAVHVGDEPRVPLLAGLPLGDRADQGAAVRGVPRDLDGHARGRPGLAARGLVPDRARTE